MQLETVDSIMDKVKWSFSSSFNVFVPYIRLDVEGSELLALRGMKRFMEDHPDSMIIMTSYMLPVYGPHTARHTEINFEMEKRGYSILDIFGRIVSNRLTDRSRIASGGTVPVGARYQNIREEDLVPLTISHQVIWYKKDSLEWAFGSNDGLEKEDVESEDGHKAKVKEKPKPFKWSKNFVMTCEV